MQRVPGRPWPRFRKAQNRNHSGDLRYYLDLRICERAIQYFERAAAIQRRFGPRTAHNAYEISALYPLTRIARCPRELGLREEVNEAVQASARLRPDPVAGYHVYRSSNGGSTYQLLNLAVDTGTTYEDTLVKGGQSYNYYVTSVDASGIESVPSNTIGVTIP